jgi:hypothetical protein
MASMMGTDFHHRALYPAAAPLSSILDAATWFGLTREEAWRTYHDAIAQPQPGMRVPEYLDQVAGALASAILAKQQRILSERRS